SYCPSLLGLFIDGRFVRPSDGRLTVDCLFVCCCAGGVTCTIVCTAEAELSICTSSSVSAFKSWSALSCSQRAKVLLRLSGALVQHGQCLCELCDLSHAPCSAPSLIRLVQYYSSWAQLRDSLMPQWTPLGVVAVVLSDDCSFYSLMVKVLPALAMGNSVIVIPGRSTAPAALLFAQLFMGVGPPAGVLNVLTGNDITLGARVAQSESINYMSYSGNKQVCVFVCRATAGVGVPVSVSVTVGSICPFVIFETADVDSAVDAVIEAAFKKNKEVRWQLFVQDSVVDSVVARLQLRLTSMKCVSVCADADRLQVDAAVQEAQQQGATLLQSCTAPPSGLQYPPTVLCGVAPSSPCVVTPPPGPLLPLMTFRSNAEAVTLGNHSPHGQAASIWTEDLTLALETAKSLSVGVVWVNSHSVSDPCLPLSGHKDSGTCTDGGQQGLYQFLRPSSSSSTPLPRSVPVSMDYTTFGGGAPLPIIPDQSDVSSSPQSFLQFVGGKACKSESGCSVAVRPPGGGGVLAYCPDGGRKDVRNAVEAALKVQPGWMKKSPSARAQTLYALAKGLESKRRDLAVSINSQTGVSMEEAEKEVELSVSRLNEWAAFCHQVQGGGPLPQSGSALSLPEPLGVIGMLLPDRKPLLSTLTVLGAAVATGNAVVMVPSQSYPLPILTFIQVLQSSDLPAGLVNIITGNKDQLTAALANHSVIKAIWYWGSAQGCQYLQHTCTSPLKTLSLFCQKETEGPEGGLDWTRSEPTFMEELWRKAVQWKSVWIPTA
uniref:Aldehyde dehydrogenase family 16 member A1-like n=1 Tax=Sphaeramia orbicularis TaxID=375764 RepID=A0A672ZIQ9_9TELE